LLLLLRASPKEEKREEREEKDEEGEEEGEEEEEEKSVEADLDVNICSPPSSSVPISSVPPETVARNCSRDRRAWEKCGSRGKRTAKDPYKS